MAGAASNRDDHPSLTDSARLRRKAGIYLAFGFLLGALVGGPVPSGAESGGLVHVGIVNPDGASLHVQIDPRIPANAVMIFHGSNVVIYNTSGATATPMPSGTIAPTRTATQPGPTATPGPTIAPTATPASLFVATVRKFPRLLVMSQPGGGDQVGAVGYGSILMIREERTWWGRIDAPISGWIDLTWCEVTR